ncbi:MAG: RecT family recombinase [Bacteroidota bacterium]|nr:RecT family recombinase [Bacteroidota bacterium]
MTQNRNSEAQYRYLAHKQLTPQIIKNVVAPNSTLEECALLIHLASKYNLDPLTGEIYILRQRTGKVNFYTSRDGYLKIANSHPAFDGIQADVVRQGDVVKHNNDGSISHTYGANRGAILGAYALAYRTDRKYPAYCFADYSEYNRLEQNTWRKYPTAMIQKVAEIMALKRAFSITGLVSKEEMGDEQKRADPFDQRLQQCYSLLDNPVFNNAERMKYTNFLKSIYDESILKSYQRRIRLELTRRSKIAA